MTKTELIENINGRSSEIAKNEITTAVIYAAKMARSLSVNDFPCADYYKREARVRVAVGIGVKLEAAAIVEKLNFN